MDWNWDDCDAAFDAITAIINARQARMLPNGDMPTDNTDIEIEVDPNLLMPKVTNDNLQNDNIVIDDPDNVLKQQKQNQNQRDTQKQGDPGNPGKQGDPGNPGKQGDPGNPGKQGDPDDNSDDDFANAWNEIMQKYDNDNIDAITLQRLIDQISNGKIKTI